MPSTVSCSSRRACWRPVRFQGGPPRWQRTGPAADLSRSVERAAHGEVVSISRTLRDGSQQESIALRGDAAKNGAITLVIQVLSLADRMGQRPAESRSDDDFAANYLLTQRADSPLPRPVPHYMTRTIPPHEIRVEDVHTVGQNEDNLCAGAFVEGF